MNRRILYFGHFILPIFVLANFMIAPVVYNPKFVSWQPGFFEIGILNTQDDAVGAHGQKMLTIPPTDGIFETKGHPKINTVSTFIPSCIFDLSCPSLWSPFLNKPTFYLPGHKTQSLQTTLCTFLI